jgi:hypothetical protein
MGVFDFTKTLCETQELHKDSELRTRYYRSSYTKVKTEITQFCNLSGMDIVNVDDTHGELFIQTKKFHIIVSIIQISPLETAVDMKVQTYGMWGMNLPKKTVLAVYKYLNEALTFKGVSLHP